jgi:hypothetical protein
VHLLLTGKSTDWDRRLIVRNAPAFAILGEEFRLILKIEDQGAVPAGLGGMADLTITIDGENVNLNEVVERKFAGDTVAHRWRTRETRNDRDVPLKPLSVSRMYAIQYEKKPRYIVFAGLVLQPLDTNLFASAKLDDVNVRRLYSDYVPKGLFTEREDIVLLTRVESDPINSQLAGFAGLAVDKINGATVKSLKHAHELLHPADPPDFHVIELFGAARPLVIPGKEVAAANQRVASTYAIERLSNLEE